MALLPVPAARNRELWVGHNPLAQIAMFAMFTLGTLFMIVTGLALYAEQWGWGTLADER